MGPISPNKVSGVRVENDGATLEPNYISLANKMEALSQTARDTQTHTHTQTHTQILNAASPGTTAYSRPSHALNLSCTKM